MTKKELVYTIRNEAWEIEEAIKKLRQRCDHLKQLADELETTGTRPTTQKPATKSKFRKIVDSIYGEKR